MARHDNRVGIFVCTDENVVEVGCVVRLVVKEKKKMSDGFYSRRHFVNAGTYDKNVRF